MSNNIPVNGWPQLKDLEAVQPILNRLDKIEAWKRTVKEETFTGDDITIENALALPARSLVTTIEPIQDLHSYDHPWAGGAGKNKWPFGDFNGTYSNIPFSLAAGTYTASKTNPDVNCGLRFFYADDTSIAFTFFTSETFTLTADVVKINYSSADATTENFMIESGSTATSFAPYSNICPISGRDSVVVNGIGKNIFDPMESVSPHTIYGFIPLPVPANTHLVMSFVDKKPTTPLSSNIGIGFSYGLTPNGVQQEINNGYTWIISSGAPSGKIDNYDSQHAVYCEQLLFYPKTALPDILDKYDIQIEIGDSITPYQPYTTTTAIFILGTTVYGADINWDTGVMTVNKKYLYVDGSDTSILSTINVQLQIAIDSDSYTTESSTDTEFLICNRFNKINNTSTESYGIYYRANGSHNLLVKNGYTENQPLSVWVEFLTTNPLQIVYKLATPTTLQLTPTQLQMLKGYNHITLTDGYGTIELKALTGANWS